MKLSVKVDKLNEFFLMISIFMIEFATYTKNIVNVTNYSQQIINVALIILFAFSVFKLFYMKVNLKKWLIVMILLFMSLLSYIVTKDSLMLQLCFLMITAYNVDFKKIIKSDLIFKLILLIYVVINYRMNNVFTPYFMRNGEMRYSFGFNQPNVFSGYLVSVFFEYIYLTNRNKKKFINIIIFILVMYFVNLAKSRAAEIILIAFAAVYLLFKIIEKFKKEQNKNNKSILFHLTFITFIVLSVFSIITTKSYINGNHYAFLLDKVLSERLMIQSMFYKAYDITFFGNEIIYFDTLDNAYMRLLLNFGIVIWMIYGFIYSFIISKAKKNNDNVIMLIFAVFLGYGLMEWYILRPALNIFLLYFAAKSIENNGDEINNEK